MTAPVGTEYVWASKDGLHLHAMDYDGGSSRLPVICIPGLTRNARDFETIAPWIAERGRRVLAVSLRGRGASDRADDPRTYKPAVYAADMVALLQSLNMPRAIFVGTSLGGLVTMTLAARHLPQVAGAVLNDIGPRISPVGLARIASYVGKGPPVASWEDAAAYVKRTNAVAFPHYGGDDWAVMARRLFREGTGGTPELDYDPRIFRPVRPIVVKLVSPLVWHAFKTLAKKRPTLVVRGETSDILDQETLALMHRKAPSLTAAEIPGVGHAPMLDEPEAKVALAAFFDRVP